MRARSLWVLGLVAPFVSSSALAWRMAQVDDVPAPVTIVPTALPPLVATGTAPSPEVHTRVDPLDRVDPWEPGHAIAQKAPSPLAVERLDPWDPQKQYLPTPSARPTLEHDPWANEAERAPTSPLDPADPWNPESSMTRGARAPIALDRSDPWNQAEESSQSTPKKLARPTLDRDPWATGSVDL